MIKTIFIVCLGFVCFSCNEVKTNNKSKQVENRIKQVSISTFGGRSTTVSETYIFTKDSIHYRYYAHDTTRNNIKSYLNKVENWKGLVENINLGKFKTIENGKSYQETDGNDTEISITTDNGKEYHKINGDENIIWNNIYKEIRLQVNK